MDIPFKDTTDVRYKTELQSISKSCSSLEEKDIHSFFITTIL